MWRDVVPNTIARYHPMNSLSSAPRGVFRQEGVDPGRITPGTKRPLFVEVPLGVLAGEEQGE